MVIKMSQKPKILLIDDVRTPAYLGIDSSIYDVTVAKNFTEGVNQLKSQTVWDILMLDHDLSSWNGDGKEMTGYDVMCFIETHPDLKPKEIQFVTANPVGRDRMEQVRKRLYEN